MNDRQRKLYAALCEMQITPPGVDVSFEARLAKETVGIAAIGSQYLDPTVSRLLIRDKSVAWGDGNWTSGGSTGCGGGGGDGGGGGGGCGGGGCGGCGGGGD